MKKNIFKKFVVLFSLSFVLFGFNFTNTIAEEISTPVPLECIVPKILNETKDACVDPAPTVRDIIVKNGCTVKDTEGIDHIFPQEDSVSEFLGVCALVSAKESGYINEFELINDSSLGLYLGSIDGKKPSSTEYWALFLNNEYASCGIGCLPVLTNDILSFVLSDWMAGTESIKISFKISSLETIPLVPAQESVSGGSGENSAIPEKTFSTSNALGFLLQNQGSSPMYMDWIAITAGAGDNQDLKSSLINYLKSNPINSSTITENERRAMALMALGINPYNGTEINYIKKIINSFNGTQFDDDSPSDINDDIFALIVLQNAGYDENDEIIRKTISYVIGRQISGSWGSVDMTAAAIMALNKFKNIEGVSDAISNAENYLLGSQNADGGFNNSSSTSWAIQALSLNSSFGAEVNNGIKYLTDKQQDDGGLNDTEIDNRIWNTSYAIPAILKLSWIDILESFEKIEEIVLNTASGSNSYNRLANIEQNDEIQEPTAIITEKTEKIITESPEIKETPVKIVKIQNKNKNVVKKEIEIKPLVEEKSNNNLLMASVGNSDKNVDNHKFFSKISNVLNKIKTPFVWLWIHLGF